jgi:hypothetical protein
MTWLAALLFLVQAFWQDKPPVDWNDIELARFLADSPWAQMAAPAGKAGTAPVVQVYLATAGPIAKAVAERNRRVALRRHIDPKEAVAEPLQEEFAAWFADNRAEHVIVAARVGNNGGFSNEAETRRMQQECAMDLGRVKVKLSGYFPPITSDPYLYLAFPREQLSALMQTAGKTVTFNLYFPGVSAPFRTLQFKIKDMLVDGKLEL